jgi:hypothetical protein
VDAAVDPALVDLIAAVPELLPNGSLADFSAVPKGAL